MTIFNKFTQYVLLNDKVETYKLFNNFIKILSKPEQEFASKNYMLIIKVGDAAKQSSPQIQQLLH